MLPASAQTSCDLNTLSHNPALLRFRVDKNVMLKKEINPNLNNGTMGKWSCKLHLIMSRQRQDDVCNVYCAHHSFSLPSNGRVGLSSSPQHHLSSPAFSFSLSLSSLLSSLPLSLSLWHRELVPASDRRVRCLCVRRVTSIRQSSCMTFQESLESVQRDCVCNDNNMISAAS